jgi:hypothetical protein
MLNCLKTKEFMKKIILVLAVLLLWPSSDAAALTVSPARIELVADPGTVVTDKFLAINEQNSDQTYYLTVENFTSQGEGGTPAFTQDKQGLVAWTQTPEQVVVGAGKEMNIPFNINIPAGAENGGYFAAVFLNTNPPSADGQNQVSVGAKVGVLIFLRVGNEIKEDAGIIEFKTSNGRKMFDSLPVTFVHRFRNSGGDRIKPQGELRITNWLGRKTINIDANPQQGNILPQSIRRYEVTWGQADANAKSFWNSVKYQWKHWAFGRYKVALVLTYGSANQAASDVLTVWIIPWQLLTLILVVLLVVLGGGRILLKRYNNWVIKQARASLR